MNKQKEEIKSRDSLLSQATARIQSLELNENNNSSNIPPNINISSNNQNQFILHDLDNIDEEEKRKEMDINDDNYSKWTDLNKDIENYINRITQMLTSEWTDFDIKDNEKEELFIFQITKYR